MRLLLVSLLMCWGDLFVSPLRLADDKRIANGMISPSGRYPFMASYQRQGEHFCGCVLITGVWVLTAAHCVIETTKYPNADHSIVAGITVLRTSPPSRQQRRVLRQYPHPYFPEGKIDQYDIGLVRVEWPFLINTDVKVINLPYPYLEFFGVVEIAGWGYVRSTYPVVSAQLRMAQMKIIRTAEECNSLIKNISNGKVTERVYVNQICVVGNNTGSETTCNGDSGGPLIAYDSQYNPTLIGIMSWNLQPCGITGSPSVATKLSGFIEWICWIIANDLYSADRCNACSIYYNRVIVN